MKDLTRSLAPSVSYLLIVFADNGLGVPYSDKRRIFEPYYSTTPHGTGLGLYIVARIIWAHNGDIVERGEPEVVMEEDTDAQPKPGARFEIFLPLAEPDGSDIPILPR